MVHHPIRRGLDLPIAGEASGAPVPLPVPARLSIDPRELRGFVPRLAVREGEAVKAGQPLFFHKFDPRVAVVAPTSGVVQEIRRGPRRVLTAVVIAPDGKDEAIGLSRFTVDALKSIGRDAALEAILAGGCWPLLRTRPLDFVPDPSVVPQGVLVAATETGPLAPGADVLLAPGDKEALQAAVYALGAIAGGKVWFTHAEGASHPAWQGLQGAEVHTFSGPHPAGDPGVQINHIAPPSGSGRVFYLRAWDAVILGRTLLEGRAVGERVYAAVGLGVQAPRYVRTFVGAPMADVVGQVRAGPLRWIRGTVLTGTAADPSEGAGWTSRVVHVLPDEVEREFLGWASPQLSRWSFHRAFLGGWSKPSKPVDLRPGMFGGHRAIVPTGVHDQVIASPDVLPVFLFKSILAGDIETSLKLGLLDITEEEAALLSYIDPSKNDWDVILREGLDAYVKEA